MIGTGAAIRLGAFALYGALSFGAGWYGRSLYEDSQDLAVAEDTLESKDKEIEKIGTDIKVVNDLNDQAALRQVEVVEKIRIVERKVPIEVLKYVPNNPDCAYSAAAVRLLNEAISTYQPGGQRDPEKPARPSKAAPADRVRDPSAARSLPVLP